MIRTDYDPKADVLHVQFGPAGEHSDTSEEIAPGVYLEFDPTGAPIGVEITSVSARSSVAETVAAA